MREATAGYYDGATSARREVTVVIDNDLFVVRGEGVELRLSVREVRLSPRLGSLVRTVRLPGGGLCEVADEAFLDELERRQGRAGGGRLIYRFEKSLGLALVALLLLAAIVWGFMKFGLPALARRVAFALPAATEASLGRESLAILDRLAFEPTRLPGERRAALAERFRAVAASFPGAAGSRLEFRSGVRVGANALALPSGIVVVTDELVSLAANDDEIAAVLAHELGHVARRHTLRHILQSSAAGLIMATLTGDVLSATSFSATLPTALVDAKFSRDFEEEADDAAVAWLRSQGIPLRRFADILGRLQQEADKKNGEKGESPLAGYLSTHPVTAERIRRFMGNGG